MGIIPVNPEFNRSQFIVDIKQGFLTPLHEKSEEAYLRERGIRYVIEAPQYMKLEEIAVLVRETLYSEFIVEPLFDASENSQTPEKLKGFFLATLTGVSFNALSQSPYDAAYQLLASTPFISVEPDLPYSRFLGSSTGSGAQAKVTAPSDKAWSLRNMRVDKAWNIQPSTGFKDGKGVSIAHLDTGWTDHDDLDQINFDYSRAADFIGPNSDAKDPLDYSGNPGHGTKTGSVIMSKGGVSASSTTGPGHVTGVAREAIYVPIRCITSVVIIYNSDVARAIRYATASKCDVISMSLGGRPMRALQLALEDATYNDLIVVSAAGNHVRFVVWPARYPEAIAVAGSNYGDKPWSGSSRGSRVDISAPAEDVYIAEPDSSMRKVGSGNGTSYATANLAGVAALWLAFHKKSVLQVIARNSRTNLQELFRYAVKSTARQPSHGWDRGKFGAGIVQVDNLLQFDLNSLTTLHSSNSNKYKQGYLFNDDKLSLFIREIVRHSHMRPYKFLEVFGNEISGLMLDSLDGIESKSDLISKLSKHGSNTLLKILRQSH